MSLIKKLELQLENRADPKTKIWWENYLKNAIRFRGVKMSDIRVELHKWLNSESIQTELPAEQQKELAFHLIQETYCEDKLAGILFFQEILLPAGAVNWREDLPRFAALFQDGYIYEWNTCIGFVFECSALSHNARANVARRRFQNGERRTISGNAALRESPSSISPKKATRIFRGFRRCS